MNRAKDQWRQQDMNVKSLKKSNIEEFGLGFADLIFLPWRHFVGPTIDGRLQKLYALCRAYNGFYQKIWVMQSTCFPQLRGLEELRKPVLREPKTLAQSPQ